jgi:hypothetical protein
MPPTAAQRPIMTTPLLSYDGPFSLLGDALPIIADTGCTMASSFDPLGFEGDIIPMASGTRMQGIGAAVTIQGRGAIKWTVIDDNGTSRVIRTPGYYVPAMQYASTIRLVLRLVAGWLAPIMSGGTCRSQWTSSHVHRLAPWYIFGSVESILVRGSR